MPDGFNEYEGFETPSPTYTNIDYKTLFDLERQKNDTLKVELSNCRYQINFYQKQLEELRQKISN